MNNDSYRQVEMQINLKEVIWDLLEQWKAILIAAILTSIIVCGLKYAKDMNAYNNGEEQKAVDKKSGLTVEQRIEEIVSALPEDEQSTVEYLIKQEGWLQAEKEYISNSILMNLNPANQRTLTLDYYISANDESNSNVLSLLDAYSGYTIDEEVVDALVEVIAPDSENRYIAELITTYKVESPRVSADETAAVLNVDIALPEDTDANAVEAAVTNALKEHSAELGKAISPHSISLLKSGESHKYNADVINNRNNILYSVYNLTNNAKNMQASLSDGQKQALESVKAIKSEQDNEESSSDNDSTVAKPGFSKKYALLGFMLGVMVYALIYLMIVIFKGKVRYASEMEVYTRARLLGVFLKERDYKGAWKLLYSELVHKCRYKNIAGRGAQITGVLSALEALSARDGAKEISMLMMPEDEKQISIASDLSDALKKKGINMKMLEEKDIRDEKSFIEVSDAVILADSGTDVSALIDLKELCSTYEVNILGSIFVQG